MPGLQVSAFLGERPRCKRRDIAKEEESMTSLRPPRSGCPAVEDRGAKRLGLT